MSSYNYQTGVSKRPLALRLLCGTVNFLAILGWLFLLVIIITIVTNTFDELDFKEYLFEVWLPEQMKITRNKEVSDE